MYPKEIVQLPPSWVPNFDCHLHHPGLLVLINCTAHSTLDAVPTRKGSANHENGVLTVMLLSFFLFFFLVLHSNAYHTLLIV